jgi:hypothetical protein
MDAASAWVTGAAHGVTVEVEDGMRATRILVAAAVLAMAGLSVLGSGAERVGLDDQLLAAADGEEHDGWLDRFDGRLYADPETGCISPWPGDDEDDVQREGVEAPRVSPRDRAVLVQEPPDGARPDGPPEAPLPDPWPPILRGPWPLCESAPSRVTDGLGDP